jgi:hypothetical protein
MSIKRALVLGAVVAAMASGLTALGDPDDGGELAATSVLVNLYPGEPPIIRDLKPMADPCPCSNPVCRTGCGQELAPPIGASV